MFEKNEIGMLFDGTSSAYKNRCFSFLDILCNDKDLEKAAKYLAPGCILIHEDFPAVKGAEAFIDNWDKNLSTMPRYSKDIQDMVVEFDPEERGIARVWVYSRISGLPNNEVRDSIDMMRFTPDGLFLESKDVQRPIEVP